MKLKDKILYCLEKSEETRNSDVALTVAVWLKFYPELVSYDSIKLASLFKLPSQDNIKRIRAKIQNGEHKFLPTSEEIRKHRKILEVWWRREMSPSNPSKY